jgi:hypothetical protein
MLTQASSSRNPKTPNNDDDIESWLGESPELLRCDTNDLSPPRLKKSLDSEEWAGGESPEMVEPELEQDICLELNLEDCNCPLPKPDCKCRSCTVYYK